jgi:hypothetical protein
MTRRCFGLDVHREFAQVAVWQDGRGASGRPHRTPEKLVSYLGLNPRVKQSGGQPSSH